MELLRFFLAWQRSTMAGKPRLGRRFIAAGVTALVISLSCGSRGTAQDWIGPQLTSSHETAFAVEGHSLQNPDRVIRAAEDALTPASLTAYLPEPVAIDELCTDCAGQRHFSFHDDAAGFFPLLRDDACGIVNWNNAAILGGALATSIAFRQNLDGRVRSNTARHAERWGDGTKALGRLGEVQYHIPVMLALYGISLKRGDDELYDFSKALISAYTINGLSTMAVKGVANTSRPSDEWNGGQFGFPSFHASSSFTMAAVVDEYYGLKAGLPAYALAGLISWSRIDERDHDLSDVFFGAAMGYVIGHAVAGRHLRCDSRVRLLPYFHPTEGSSGLMVDLSF